MIKHREDQKPMMMANSLHIGILGGFIIPLYDFEKSEAGVDEQYWVFP